MHVHWLRVRLDYCKVKLNIAEKQASNWASPIRYYTIGVDSHGEPLGGTDC